jgi:hypothetical protein
MWGTQHGATSSNQKSNRDTVQVHFCEQIMQPGARTAMAMHGQCVLCSGQRDFHANARCQGIAADAGHTPLVAEPRTDHLPAAPPAGAAHPHAT